MCKKGWSPVGTFTWEFSFLDMSKLKDLLKLKSSLEDANLSVPSDLLAQIAEEEEKEAKKNNGCVYILKNKYMPDIYKIGSTTTSVTERIKNAVNEPTYLYAGVDVVETYRCFNMGARELEDRVHTFFDKVRLNINILDERGAVISPREWFCVKLEAIGEAIDLILQGKANDYVYDPSSGLIVAK